MSRQRRMPWCKQVFLIVSWLLVGQPALSEESTLRLGILPYNSTLALIKTHQPLRQFLQAKLGRPVEIFTASDYQSYLREQLQGNYDLMITPPHFAVLAKDKGYIPLLHYKARLEPIMVMRKDDPSHNIQGLKGRRIAMVNRFAFVSIVGEKWMNDNAMRPQRDFTVIERPTHGAAIAAVAVGDADGALTTTTLLGQVPDDVRQQLRYVSFGVKLPHVAFMAHQRLGGAEIKRIKEALLAFASAPEGQVFFKETSYLGFEEISDSEMAVFQPYVVILKQQLGPGFFQ